MSHRVSFRNFDTINSLFIIAASVSESTPKKSRNFGLESSKMPSTSAATEVSSWPAQICMSGFSFCLKVWNDEIGLIVVNTTIDVLLTDDPVFYGYIQAHHSNWENKATKIMETSMCVLFVVIVIRSGSKFRHLLHTNLHAFLCPSFFCF